MKFWQRLLAQRPGKTDLPFVDPPRPPLLGNRPSTAADRCCQLRGFHSMCELHEHFCCPAHAVSTQDRRCCSLTWTSLGPRETAGLCTPHVGCTSGASALEISLCAELNVQAADLMLMLLFLCCSFPSFFLQCSIAVPVPFPPSLYLRCSLACLK